MKNGKSLFLVNSQHYKYYVLNKMGLFILLINISFKNNDNKNCILKYMTDDT